VLRYIPWSPVANTRDFDPLYNDIFNIIFPTLCYKDQVSFSETTVAKSQAYLS